MTLFRVLGCALNPGTQKKREGESYAPRKNMPPFHFIRP